MTFTQYVLLLRQHFSDVMLPGIAARCLSHGNVIRPAFLVLCFPASVKLSCSNVVKFIGRSSQQAPQHSFPHHGFRNVVLEILWSCRRQKCLCGCFLLSSFHASIASLTALGSPSSYGLIEAHDQLFSLRKRAEMALNTAGLIWWVLFFIAWLFFQKTTRVCIHDFKQCGNQTCRTRTSTLGEPAAYNGSSAWFAVYGQAAATYRFPSDHRSQAPSSGVSTWMGDHPGTPRAVGNTWCTRHMAKPRPQVGRVC